MKNIKEIYWILATQFGIDILKIIKSIKGLKIYVNEAIKFRKLYNGIIEYKPCLYDRFEEGGSVNSEYFWQDIAVSKMIYNHNPQKHVDIGSRIDGFVAQVSIFRNIEVFDIRPIEKKIPGIIFKQADIMNEDIINGIIKNIEGYCDSVSCLHAIEHFGLGRYGDSIDIDGYKKGIKNIALLIKKDGILYLSTPVGRERVEFNANRVFDPKTIINIARDNLLDLAELYVYDTKYGMIKIPQNNSSINSLSEKRYSLALFVFKKK